MKPKYINPVPRLEDFSRSNNRERNENAEYDGKYRETKNIYFAFIDVLGFKQTFQESGLTNKTDPLQKYDKVFGYYFDLLDESKLDKDASGSLRQYKGQTSDSLYFYTENIFALIDFIKIFSHFNRYAMTQNIFFRGGIAKGSLYLRYPHQFYGSGVINAYLLESVVASKPVIYLDSASKHDIESIKQEQDDFIISVDNRSYIKPSYVVDENELRCLIPSERLIIKPIDMEIVKKVIEENLKKFEFDPHNYSKYNFLYKELFWEKGE